MFSFYLHCVQIQTPNMKSPVFVKIDRFFLHVVAVKLINNSIKQVKDDSMNTIYKTTQMIFLYNCWIILVIISVVVVVFHLRPLTLVGRSHIYIVVNVERFIYRLLKSLSSLLSSLKPENQSSWGSSIRRRKDKLSVHRKCRHTYIQTGCQTDRFITRQVNIQTGFVLEWVREKR